MLRKRIQGAPAAPRATKGSIIKYHCSFSNTISDVLASRGWRKVDEDSDWGFVWADREWVYAAFDKLHLESWQRLNHFRNGRELCRKDLMAKNMKRRRRALEKEGRADEAAAYDFIPTTFVLPKEYSMFVEEFKKSAGVWIMKPIGSAQGKGIFLFSRLSEISDWRTDFKAYKPGMPGPKAGKEEEREVEAYVVQVSAVSLRLLTVRLSGCPAACLSRSIIFAVLSKRACRISRRTYRPFGPLAPSPHDLRTHSPPLPFSPLPSPPYPSPP